MIKKTAWNTAKVQTDKLRQMDAAFCWGVEKIYQENAEGATEPASCSFLFRANSTFHEKRQEKRNLNCPSLLLFLLSFSPSFFFGDHE